MRPFEQPKGITNHKVNNEPLSVPQSLEPRFSKCKSFSKHLPTGLAADHHPS